VPNTRIQIRLWPEIFRVTDGRIYNGYKKTDNILDVVMDVVSDNIQDRNQKEQNFIEVALDTS